MVTPGEVSLFCAHLSARNYSPHTVESYRIDLRLFFESATKPPSEIIWREVDDFIRRQHRQGLAATTINRRLNAVKRFFDYIAEERIATTITANPVKPSHFLRTGRPLPKKLTREQVRNLFAAIDNLMDRALFLLMLRGGLRVSEAVKLKTGDIDWEQKTLLVEQGKGRKDRWVYLSADALSGLHECLRRRPQAATSDYLFWNQKRMRHPLTVKAVQKKMERYAHSAGLKASCHNLRHTFASNLLEEGAEVVSIRELLGHSSIASSERYARLSNRMVKQEYMQTIRKVINKTRV
jgi:site-specific recombinase XerD